MLQKHSIDIYLLLYTAVSFSATYIFQLMKIKFCASIIYLHCRRYFTITDTGKDASAGIKLATFSPERLPMIYYMSKKDNIDRQISFHFLIRYRPNNMIIL